MRRRQTAGTGENVLPERKLNGKLDVLYTKRRMERDMKYITKNLDFQLDKRSVVTSKIVASIPDTAN